MAHATTSLPHAAGLDYLSQDKSGRRDRIRHPSQAADGRHVDAKSPQEKKSPQESQSPHDARSPRPRVTSAAAPAPDGLPPERRRLAILAIFTALAMASLDTAIANVALPAIASDLHVTPADVVWVVNIYQIAMVATLLPLAALGEIVGHQRVYLGGLVLFTLASLLCAFAWSLPTLLVARLLQGLGASGIMSVNTALVRFVYPRRLHGHGFGMNALVVATAFTIGPTVASSLLSVGPWTWLFGVNVPFGIAAVLVGMRTLPQTPRLDHAFDLPGALLTTACLGLFITAIGSGAHDADLRYVALLLAGAILLGLLLMRRQAGHPAPMLPIDLFRRPMFALSAVTAMCSFACQGLAFVSLPFYFEHNLGLTAVATGFLITPWSLTVGIMAPIAGRLSNHYPAGVLGGIGLVVLAIGMALLATLPEAPRVIDIVWRMVVCGMGFGFFQSPNMQALMSSAPSGRSGGASGIVATARLTGQTTGAALAALCFGLFAAHGPTVALALGAGFAAVGSVMSFLRLVATRPA
ncbi:MFS transporter [Bradyrhizobium sp. U87765 SZCCT0131]|nr:MFS transporter [Bradyrhizobium sp. U87765 SZCCT0131]MBR1259974.1 MFS transporter [Bradyrhizobium sp. U87765 SZCCT0134]MBR1307777.1 MFS transporter [Bradyrhizobium sp. U87765 SZCCT0110]MBR1321731.1 MFS transporter [Bradyrhizobium sp. U87765 SZCCT0109]MBR1350043.1 MFS transporter [Bradyrhizobium sp. U87765 SZCCT0048]